MVLLGSVVGLYPLTVLTLVTGRLAPPLFGPLGRSTEMVSRLQLVQTV